MLRVETGKGRRYCDGISRRSAVQLGLAGVASFGLPGFLRAKALSTAAGFQEKDTSMILLWLGGGPSQLDTYDMKPDAPAEIRGLWRPTRTNVPGIDICEHLPQQAKRADKFSLIRSFHHKFTGHFAADHKVLTGRAGIGGKEGELKFPSFGSIATKFTGPRVAGMPAYVSVPTASAGGSSPGCFGGHFLGPQYDPFQTGGDPNDTAFSVDTFNFPVGMTLDKLEDRQSLAERLNQFRYSVETPKVYDAMDNFQRDAYHIVTSSKAQRAFQITDEDPKTRDRYGRDRWGQSTLMARRLVEAGSRLVTVAFGAWDHHGDIERDFLGFNFPRLDAAVSALLDDLEDRGILDKVLVAVMGEFGRTPKINTGGPVKGSKPGRDHWPGAMSILLAGGGVQPGRVIGATNQHAAYPIDRPVTPADMHATIYHVLGLDPELRFPDRDGRPRPAIEHGDVVHELF